MPEELGPWVGERHVSTWGGREGGRDGGMKARLATERVDVGQASEASQGRFSL